MQILLDAILPPLIRVAGFAPVARAVAKSVGATDEEPALFKGDPDKVGSSLIREINVLVACRPDPVFIDLPVAIFVGEKKASATKERARELGRPYRLPSIHVASGLGQAWPLEDPGLFTQVIRYWMSGRERGDGFRAMSVAAPDGS